MNPSRARYAIRGALCVLIALASPLAAQTTNSSTTNSATPSTATSNDVVGPRELQNFSLGGTVTRQADPVASQPPAQPGASPATTAPRAAVRDAPRAPAPAERRPTETAPQSQQVAGPSRQVIRNDPIALAPPPAVTEPVAPAAEAELLPDQETPSSWPWWIAAAVLAAGAGLLLWRRRQRHDEPAVAGMAHGFVAREPVPAPTPAPSPAPVARPRRPLDAGGIVSRGLQPKIAFEFKPLRAELDAEGTAALVFDVVVVNSGSAPARNVLVEASMVSAGPNQDAEIAQFFRNPVGRGDRLPVIPPMGRVTLRSRAMLPPERQSPIEIEGRKLLVPLVALNALYRGGSGEEQSSASYLVGRAGGEGGKMGPLRLDRGARAWTDLGVRPHSAGLQQ